MSRTISTEVLIGIHQVLETHKLELLPTFNKLFLTSSVEDPLASPSWRPGTVVATITATVSWQDGEPILRALEEIDREQRGAVLMSNGLALDWLIIEWRRFVEPPQP